MGKRLRDIYYEEQGVCWLCGQPAKLSNSNKDHVIPVSHNGTNHRANLRLAHINCNSKRGNTSPPVELMAAILIDIAIHGSSKEIKWHTLRKQQRREWAQIDTDTIIDWSALWAWLFAAFDTN